MKLVKEKIYESEWFDESNPTFHVKKSLGNMDITEKIERLKQNRYLLVKHFDEELVEHLFNDVYKKWKRKSDIDRNDIKIWVDETDAGTPIIKWKAPGLRTSTFLRGESPYFQEISNELRDFLNTDHIKTILLNSVEENLNDPMNLAEMIMSAALRKGLPSFSSINQALPVAEKLITLNN